MTGKSSGNDKVISLEEIQEKARGILVKIPDWEPKKEILVRLRSIDITPLLLESGAFINELSAEVETLFDTEENKDKKAELEKKANIEKPKKPTPQMTKDRMEKFLPVLDAIAKEALAEPTYDEIEKIYPLNLQQKMAIFMHVTRGIDKYKPFR